MRADDSSIGSRDRCGEEPGGAFIKDIEWVPSSQEEDTVGIRVPRITLKTEFDDDVAFGDLNLLSVGYGLHQAWIYATMFASTSIFTAQTYVFSAYGVSLSLAFIISIATFGLCLLLAALANRRLAPLFHSRKLLGIGAVLMCAGTVLILPLFPLDTSSVAFLEVISGILTGVGSSILTVFWGSAFARSDATSIMLNSAFAISFAIGIYALILQQLPSPLNGVLTALLPFFEWAILWTKTPSEAAWDQIPRFNPLPTNRLRFLFRFGGPVFVLGTALGILRQTSISYTLGNATTSGSVAVFLAAMCATVAVLMTLIALEKSKPQRPSTSLAFASLRFLIPAIGVAVFFLPFSLAGNSPIADVILVAGYMCFEALMWIFFGELSHRFRLSPILVFGTGRGLLALGSLAGAIIPILFRNVESLQSLGDEWSTMIILLALVISYAALPNDREMTAIVTPCPLLLSLADEARRPTVGAQAAAGTLGATGFASNATAGTNARESDNVPNAADGATNTADADDIAPVSANAADSSQAPEAVEAGNAANTAAADATDTQEEIIGVANESGTALNSKEDSQKAPDGEVSKSSASGQPEPPSAQSAQSEAASPMQPNTPANGKQEAPVSAARQAMLRNDKQAAGESGEQRRYGRFRNQIEDIAGRYLLSKRETEILFYLAKGQNSAYIQEKLYISEGTAKTHIRHVYRKLDVHSQHELMRLVEDIIRQESGRE